MPYTNHLGQPIGAPLPNWTAPAPLEAVQLDGAYCCLEPFDGARHAQPLFDAFAQDTSNAMWTYLPLGPMASVEELMGYSSYAAARGWVPLVVIDQASGRALGTASFMRIDAANGVAEIGAVIFSPAMQQSRISTEAIYLMMDHMFDMGYRRVEWKCNALNAASRRAALRFGFSFEGVFRQSWVVKGHNRDTAWFACIDEDWPKVKATIQTWLAAANFDDTGRQKQSLSSLTRPLLHWPDMQNGV